MGSSVGKTGFTEKAGSKYDSLNFPLILAALEYGKKTKVDRCKHKDTSHFPIVLCLNLNLLAFFIINCSDIQY